MRRSESSRKLSGLVHGNPKQIRNLCILAHVDHGKTTLADALVASNGIISQRMSGKLRYMDSREDEQIRGITMKSSSIALHYQYEEDDSDYLINLIDSPGHIDFSSEVSTAVRLCDGAIIVIDVVEGVCPQTYAALSQAWHENLKPVLVMNKIDRLIVELKFTPAEAHSHLMQVLEKVNAITGELFASDLYEKHHCKETPVLVSPEERLNDWTIALDDIDDSNLYFAPELGNVVFASALDCWGFCINDFSQMFAVKLGLKPEILNKTLWGDFYLNAKAKRIHKCARDKGKKTLFVQFILENLWSVYEAIAVNRDMAKIEKIVSSLGLKVNVRDLKHNDSKICLNAVMNQWLPLSKSILTMVVNNIPSPLEMMTEKVEKLMCHKSRQFDSLHQSTKDLKEHFMACKSDNAPVIVFVSKMLPYDRKSLPQNRARPLTSEEIADRRELARKRNLQGANISKSATEPELVDSEPKHKEPEPKGPVFIAFARIYSGILRKGQPLFVLGPKHDPKEALDAMFDGSTIDPLLTVRDLSSSKHVTTFTVSNLYMLMGRELEELEVVPAGNIVGISGLEDHILKSATLSTTIACPPFTEMTFQAAPIVRVAIDPENPSEMPQLIQGMKLLNQADPCVEVRVQETGEHVIIAAGEVHLQRCIDDLKVRYAQIELNVSPPIVPFRETIVVPPLVDMVNEAVQDQLQSPLVEVRSVVDGLVEIFTPGKTAVIAIRARPLPEDVVTLLTEKEDLLKTLHRYSWLYENSRSKTEALNETSRKELTEFRHKLEDLFANHEDEWSDTVSKIWCFGPRHRGPNILVNKVPLYESRPSIWQSLYQDEKSNLREFDNNVIHGFQIATSAGPLCEEPLMGVCFQVERWDFIRLPKTVSNFELSHTAKISSDIETIFEDHLSRADVVSGHERASSDDRRKRQTCSSGATSGQLISCVKDACRKAFQTQPQRLMVAMYSCSVQVSSEVLGKLNAVIGKRNGRVLFEDLREGSSGFIVKAVIPVVESFGFAEELRKKTSGLAIPQLQFSHWDIVDTDPFWVPTTEEEYLYHGERADSENLARKYMNDVRRRKGLVVDEQIVASAEKQRTLSKNK